MIKRITTTYKNLNLNIEDLAEINYFVGKNGSGKTRLFEILGIYQLSRNPEEKIDLQNDFDSIITINNDSDYIGYQPVNLNQLMGKKEENISGGKINEQEISSIILNLIFDDQAVFNDSDWSISLNDNLKISLEETPSGFESLFKFWLTTFVNFPRNIRGKKIYWFVCLDELDRHLHPSISKKVPELLNKLQSHLINYCKEKYEVDVSLQFFISTHSPFLIRGALQHDKHKIFHLENGMLKNSFDKQKLIEQSGLPFDNVLSDLGFEMKDIYYPNCLIYVEGPVEVLFLSYWLEKYFESKGLTNNHFVKGIDYDFVEFGGSLAAHLSLKFNSHKENETVLDKTELVNIFSLNRKVFVMVDNDTDKKAFEKTKQRLKKEIQEKNNGSVFYRNSKYSTIESLLTKSTKRSKRKKDKLGAALVNLNFWRKNNIGLDKFNPETVRLCESIFDFIEKSNI